MHSPIKSLHCDAVSSAYELSGKPKIRNNSGEDTLRALPWHQRSVLVVMERSTPVDQGRRSADWLKSVKRFVTSQPLFSHTSSASNFKSSALLLT